MLRESLAPILKRWLVWANIIALVALLLLGADWWVRIRIVQGLTQYHQLVQRQQGRATPPPTPPVGKAPGAP